jgi:hypothetical protein
LIKAPRWGPQGREINGLLERARHHHLLLKRGLVGLMLLLQGWLLLLHN